MGEVKCLELEEVLEEQGYKEDEIEEKVSAYRKMLISKEGEKKRFAEVDEFGRPVLKETHQIAEAQKEKNAKLKDAFGISKHFVEGSSFDPNRRELDEAAREEARSKTRRETEEPRREKRKPSSSSSESEDSEKEKKRKKKKKKKSRSDSRGRKEKKRSVSRGEKKRNKSGDLRKASKSRDERKRSRSRDERKKSKSRDERRNS